MEQVQVGTSTIHYLDCKSSQRSHAPILLLVHGFPLDHSMWRYQIQPLAERCRVLCPDLPGFGRSPAGMQPISMRQMADELAGFLDQLNIERVVFCGLSMGGYIGWQFWRHYGQRLSGLIACDTRASADSDSVARARRISANLVREQGTAALADELVGKLFSEATLESRQDIVASLKAVIVAADAESVAQAQLGMASRPDVTSWLPEIELPTLFLVGEHDSITPPAEMQAMAARVPDSTTCVIQDSGHLPPLENSQEFNRVVLKFLTQIGESS
jgi:pimeloyl-ACP methyl ester carboxylesterase